MVYVEEAKDVNLVEIGIFKDMKYVQLVDTGAQWCPRSEYVPLVKTMQHSLRMVRSDPHMAMLQR